MEGLFVRLCSKARSHTSHAKPGYDSYGIIVHMLTCRPEEAG